MELNVISGSLFDTKEYELQAQVFKALTHPARLAIMDILRDGEHCVCHIEAYLGLRQAYISQQLAVLREAGLIHDRRDGWNIFYRVSTPKIFEILGAVRGMLGQEQVKLKDPAQVSCPCPDCSSDKIRKSS
jgi:DNA-binding transcriptional ArsR family regulator